MKLPRRTGQIIAAIIGVCLVLLLIAPTAWSSNNATYHGLVLDAKTFEPIEGAVVKSEWFDYKFQWVDSDVDCHLGNDAVSDKDGHWELLGPRSYRIVPSYYGPRKCSEILMDYFWIFGLIEEMPHIFAQKDGYEKSSTKIYSAEHKDRKGFLVRGGDSFWEDTYREIYKQKYPQEARFMGKVGPRFIFVAKEYDNLEDIFTDNFWHEVGTNAVEVSNRPINDVYERIILLKKESDR